MQSALAAVQLLTLAARFNGVSLSPQRIGSAALYFPLVGLLLGLIVAFLNRILEPYLTSEILAAVLTTTLILITGALHLEGTQKTFDTLPARTSIGSATGNAAGVYGLIAVLLVVLLKIRAVEVIGETRGLLLLLSPVLARWSLVVFLYGCASVAQESIRPIADNVRAWHLFLTTAATLAFAVYLVGRIGLWVGLCLSLFALLSRSYLSRRHGGLTYDNFGAIIELSETLSFVLLASL